MATRRDKLLQFFNAINKIDTKIDFTMELEETNKLLILDILLIKEENGTTGHSVLIDNLHKRILKIKFTSPSIPIQQGALKALLCRSDKLINNK